MPSRRRRKRRRGAGVNATKSDIQTHLEKIPGAKCVQDYVSGLSSKEFNKLMKTYVKPLQKGGRRRTRKRRGGQPNHQWLAGNFGAAYPGAYGTTGNGRPIKSSRNTPECGRCLAVCRCGNANRSPECRQCVSGRSMKSSRGTRRRARDGNHGIRRRGSRGNVPELEPRPRQEGPRAREDSRFDTCSPAKALCSARGPKSTACKQEKVCNDAIMAEIERLAEKNLNKGGESWRGQGRRERHAGPQDIPPEVAEASSFAEGLLDRIPASVRNQAPGVMFGIIAAMIASYLWSKCRRRRGAGGNGGSDGGSSGGRTIYPDDAYEAGSSVATPSTVGPMVDENNNASSGASAATMGGRRRSRRRRSRRRRRTRRRRRRRRR